MRGHSAPSWPLPLCLAPAGTPATTAAVGSGQLEQAECDLHTGAALACVEQPCQSTGCVYHSLLAWVNDSIHGFQAASPV